MQETVSNAHSIHALNAPPYPFILIKNLPLDKVVQLDFHYWQPKGQILTALQHIIQCVRVKVIFNPVWVINTYPIL